MKKIKIYMQYPWIVSDSNYYKYLLEYPPKNVDYINKIKKIGNITDKKKFKINNYIKQNLKKIITRIYRPIPNVHFTKNANKYDLIHCAHCLSLNKKPWVTDIEYPGQFWVSSNKTKGKKRIKKLLMSKNCKKILAWTEWTKKEILKMFPEMKDKIEIITYAISLPKIKKKKRKEITLTFISRRFLFKGGLHAVEIIDRLTKKHANVYGIIVSDIPKEILNKYSANKKIQFFDILPYDKIMNKIFPETDIFVYPSYTDTFGFLMVEALSFGVPVITVGGQTRREIIEDRKTGFIIDEPKNLNIKSLKNLKDYSDIINELEKKTELLIKNKNLREKMSKNAIKEIRNGKFSIMKRNKKLKRIYKEALEN